MTYGKISTGLTTQGNNRKLRSRRNSHFKKFGGTEKVDWAPKIEAYKNSTPEQLAWVRKEVRRQKVIDIIMPLIVAFFLVYLLYYTFLFTS